MKRALLPALCVVAVLGGCASGSGVCAFYDPSGHCVGVEPSTPREDAQPFLRIQVFTVPAYAPPLFGYYQIGPSPKQHQHQHDRHEHHGRGKH